MILELTVAMIILGALMGVCLKWFAATARQRQAADHRQVAAREAANTMERLFARSWEQLHADIRRPGEASSKKPTTQPPLKGLPEGEVSSEITPVAGEPDAIQIAVTVRWPAGRVDRALRDRNRVSQSVVPVTNPTDTSPSSVDQEEVRFVAWRFRANTAPQAKGAVK